MTVLRHLISILLLPVMVLVVVPRWLLRAAHSDRDIMISPGGFAGISGAILFLAGLTALTWCIALFSQVGRGTLAPWDPTRRLVAVGPYRYVRNPMIMSVTLMLAGEALLFRSTALGGWLAAFVLINHLYFVVLEEPGLARRFGASYLEYKQRVPRWIPRKPR